MMQAPVLWMQAVVGAMQSVLQVLPSERRVLPLLSRRHRHTRTCGTAASCAS